MFRCYPSLSHNTRASRARRSHHPFPHGFVEDVLPHRMWAEIIQRFDLIARWDDLLHPGVGYIFALVRPLSRVLLVFALAWGDEVEISPKFLDLASLACPPALAFRLPLSYCPPLILCPSLVSGLSDCRRADGSSARKVVWLHQEESLSYLADASSRRQSSFRAAYPAGSCLPPPS